MLIDWYIRPRLGRHSIVVVCGAIVAKDVTVHQSLSTRNIMTKENEI